MNYAGVGSRETPPEVLSLMRELAFELGEAGWVLRSGAADGADAAFEAGLAPEHAREIWLPAPRFNRHPSKLFPSAAAFELAAKVHPAWNRCNAFARKLHARNCHQVLGADLDDPVAMVVCWTAGGRGAGGTGQALRLAKLHEIPIFDLGKEAPERVIDEVREFASALMPMGVTP